MNMIELFEAALETKINAAIDSKLSNMQTRIVELEDALIAVRADNVDLRDQIDRLQDRIDQLENDTLNEDSLEDAITSHGYLTTLDVEEMIEQAVSRCVTLDELDELGEREYGEQFAQHVLAALQNVKLSVTVG